MKDKAKTLATVLGATAIATMVSWHIVNTIEYFVTKHSLESKRNSKKIEQPTQATYNDAMAILSSINSPRDYVLHAGRIGAARKYVIYNTYYSPK